MIQSIFKAKRKDNGEWVEGYIYGHESPLQCIGPKGYVPEQTKWYILQTGFADWSMPRPVDFIEVDPNTISQYIGANCWNADQRHLGKKIFMNDIVRIAIGNEYVDYLLWDLREIPYREAIALDKDYYFNGVDYHSEHMISWEDFMLYLHDPWGDHDSVEVIGNIFDNPELLNNVDLRL
nr:MAG TPA: YopX protein [Caudoviricetes sp.]